MTSQWVLSTCREQPRARLVCLPFAGGGASLFRRWSLESPPWLQVCRVQLPGREERIREAPWTSLPDVVATLARELGDGPPTAIFGHSMGGLLAFELAHALSEAGTPPLRLFVSGARPPHRPDPHQLHRLEGDAFFEALVQRGGTPREVIEHEELRAMVGTLLQGDLRLAETWLRPAPVALPVPITVCASRDDQVVSWETIAAWSACSTRGHEQHEFPGDHFFIRSQEDALRRLVFTRIADSLDGRR